MPPVTNSSIESLIQELADLRIRVAQLEAAATEPVAQLEAAATEPGPINEGSESDLSPGDRVLVKNKVKRPATWNIADAWNQQAAQRATVTHFYKDQVHFITDNGVSTWRARNNLSKLSNLSL